MWLLRFRFSLHLAAEKPDPWFACGIGVRKGGPWIRPAPGGLSLPCKGAGSAAGGLGSKEGKPGQPYKPHSSALIFSAEQGV